MTLWIGWGVAALLTIAWAVTWRLLSAARDEAEEAHRQAQRLLQQTRDELTEARAAAARRLRSAQDDARFAGKALAEAMIPVEDAMTLAVLAEGDLESVRDGVSLVKKQLRGALASAGITPFEPELGAPFDPHTQECLLLPGGADGGDVVIDKVDRIGWRHHERLLRPAQVRLKRSALDSDEVAVDEVPEEAPTEAPDEALAEVPDEDLTEAPDEAPQETPEPPSDDAALHDAPR